MDLSDQEVVNLLESGKIVVIPTDTIYGIVGSALNPKTVEKIYQLRKRSSNKPFIILIFSLNDLNHFNIKLSDQQKKFLQKYWPNPLSVVLSCPDKKFKYLHRGENSLAFRVPKNYWLKKLLKQVGPLVAPSANFEGAKPPQTINDAKKYFGDKVSFYLDGGRLESEPSTVVQLKKEGSWKVLRQGKYKFS